MRRCLREQLARALAAPPAALQHRLSTCSPPPFGLGMGPCRVKRDLAARGCAGAAPQRLSDGLRAALAVGAGIAVVCRAPLQLRGGGAYVRAGAAGGCPYLHEAMAASMSLDEIRSNFALLDDWEDRYRYVIELGRVLPPLDDALRTEATKVRGCASQVWLVSHAVPQASRRGSFQGDSDALIVRGLIAILLAAVDGKTAPRLPRSICRANSPGSG